MNFSQYVSLTVGSLTLAYSASYVEDGTLTLTVDFSAGI
jgi:hypothetical protein